METAKNSLEEPAGASRVAARSGRVHTKRKDNSCTISQSRSIALLNVEGKIFFSVLAKRLTNFLMENEYMDTSCQKAGIPGFPV